MRFSIPQHDEFELRVRTFFAWLPITPIAPGSKETRWLEVVTVEEIFYCDCWNTYRFIDEGKKV